MMKGVAILLMLFLHLFNNLGFVDICHNLIFINGEPLVYILSRASNPVAFFLILGGYGLYKVNEHGDKHRWSRMLKLLLHYWLIMLVFVIIGHFMHPDIYPGSFNSIISNITAFHTTYNGEMWFLFPYIILSLLAQWIFKLMKPFKAWQIILVTLIIHLGTSFVISSYGNKYLFSNYWLYNPLLVFHLLFSFCLGALAVRERYFERLKDFASNYLHNNIIAWGG